MLEILPTAGEWQESLFIAGDGYQLELSTGVLSPWHIRAVENLTLAMDESSPASEPNFISNGAYAETATFLDAVADNKLFPTATLADALASSRLAADIAEFGVYRPER